MENISNNICVICRDEMTTESSQTLSGARAFARTIHKKEVLTTLPCGHRFHYECIKPWANINPQCPIDRLLITNTAFCSVNMQKELLRSVKGGGKIGNVRVILSTGFNPNQRSFLHKKKSFNRIVKRKTMGNICRADQSRGDH